MITQSALEFSKVWVAEQHKRHDHPEDYQLISTGLKELDTILGGGYEKGQFVVIGGAQKSGKTTLLSCFMRAAANQKKHFVWFGAEMNNLQLGSMVYSNITGIERKKIRSIGLEILDWKKIATAGEEIENWRGYFNYGFSTVKDVVTVVDRIENETGECIEVIFGDYFQLMEEKRFRGNRVSELEAISRGLKHLTIDRPNGNPIAVVYAAQLNRQSIRGGNIDANSFLGTGALERDMDLGMIIHDVRDDITNRPKENMKRIALVGSRETGIGELDVLYNGATATIADNIPDQMPLHNFWS